MTVYTISAYKQVLKIYISSSLFLQKVMKICFEFSKLYDIKKWQNNFFCKKWKGETLPSYSFLSNLKNAKTNTTLSFYRCTLFSL